MPDEQDKEEEGTWGDANGSSMREARRWVSFCLVGGRGGSLGKTVALPHGSTEHAHDKCSEHMV